MPIFAYPVKMSRTIDGQLTGIFCPDLEYEMPLPNELNNDNKLMVYAHENLQNFITQKIQHNIPIKPPRNMNYYTSNIRNTNAQDTWTNVYLDINIIKGPFETYIPKIGQFNGIVFAFLLTVVSYFAVKYSSKSLAVAIIGTIFRTAMNLIAYYYSEAAGTSSTIGKIIDKKCVGTIQTMSPESDPNVNPRAGCISTTARVISKIGAGSTPLVASAVIAWTGYQENLALADKIQPTEGDIAANILRIIAIALALSSGYLNVTFFMSFLPPLFADLDKIANKLNCHSPNEGANAHHEEDSLINNIAEVPSYGSRRPASAP